VIPTKEMIKNFLKEFEAKIQELGFTIISSRGGFYRLCDKNDCKYLIKIQLFLSKSALIRPDGSPNERITQLFSFFNTQDFDTSENPDAVIISFRNLQNNLIEYLIIPGEDFKNRLARIIKNSTGNKRINLVLWLLEDGSVFDTTDISPEGEWYFISKGNNGRMADGTDLDFTNFLNDWKKLTRN
jgi:hypothetical protein